MKRIVLFLLLFLWVFPGLVLSQEIPEIVERDGVLWVGDGFLMEVEGLKVAYFTGTPLEIGLQQGLLIVDQPDEMKELLLSLNPAYGAKAFSERISWFFKDLYARFQFYPSFLSYTPDEYLQEMKGFILGASRGEEDNIYDILMGNAYQDLSLAGGGCSVFAAWGEATFDGHMYVGRNLDHMGFLDLAQYQFVAIYNPQEGYPFVVHNYPSFVGTMSGMNSEGLVISSNYSLAQEDQITVHGMPFMIMIRHVLQYASSLEEALDMIKRTPRTVGLNLMVADAKTQKAVIVEVTANRMALREGEDFIFSTNMFHHPYMVEYQAPGWLASHLRDERFFELGQEHYGQIDLYLARDFLRDTFKVGSPPREGFISGINSHSNLAALIFVPGKQEIWVSSVGEELPPFAADSTLVGIDVKGILETGRPLEPLGVLPPTPREGYKGYWFMVQQAEYHFNKGENGEALKISLQVLEEYPQAEMPLLLAGQSLNRMGRYKEGLEYLDRFLDRKVHGEPFHLMRVLFWSGLYRDHLGMRDEAIEYYQRALKVEIEDISFQVGGIEDYCRIGLSAPLAIRDGMIVTREGG